MSVSSATPSPFATLLRRSKFATFDPSIGQVYTSHGGHAHRGHWGLKRPLPNRRRGGFITVRSVDSPEQQTEWNSAESSARWMRRWEEMGKRLEMEELGSWFYKALGAPPFDSEFSNRRGGDIVPGRKSSFRGAEADASNSLPNPEHMLPKQFSKYLERIRDLRPEFKAYLDEHLRNAASEQKSEYEYPRLPSEIRASTLRTDGTGGVDMFASAQNSGNAFINKFLSQRAKQDLYSPDSKRIERQPHRTAGLEYTTTSLLQSYYLHKPIPGRDIAQSRPLAYENSFRLTKVDLVAVGGIIGALPKTDAVTLLPTDFGTRDTPRTDRGRGTGLFRVVKAKLLDPPVVVGPVPQKATETKFKTIELRMLGAEKTKLSNPYPLGTIDYVGCEGITRSKAHAGVVPLTHLGKRAEERAVYTRNRAKTQESSMTLLGALESMIHRKKPDA